MVRQCAGCQCPDAPYYDFLQRCTCEANPARHGLAEHEPPCFRVRHKVIPYRIKLRKWKQTDGRPETNGAIALGVEHAYYTGKGFHGRVHSGFLWAEKLMCAVCIQKWEAAQEQKRLYEQRVAEFTKPERESYYQMLGRN